MPIKKLAMNKFFIQPLALWTFFLFLLNSQFLLASSDKKIETYKDTKPITQYYFYIDYRKNFAQDVDGASFPIDHYPFGIGFKINSFSLGAESSRHSEHYGNPTLNVSTTSEIMALLFSYEFWKGDRLFFEGIARPGAIQKTTETHLYNSSSQNSSGWNSLMSVGASAHYEVTKNFHFKLTGYLESSVLYLPTTQSSLSLGGYFIF